MRIGDYDFKELSGSTIKDIPVSCGVVLIQDKASGLFDIAVANNIQRRAQQALLGDLTPNFLRMYPVAPEQSVNLFYMSLGAVARPTVHKHRLRMALAGKLVQRTTRGTYGEGYVVRVFTYPETSEYVIAVQTMASHEDPMSRLYRMLNRKMYQNHKSTNHVIRKFCKKHGPFNEKNSLIMETHKENIPTLQEAKQTVRDLALSLGTEYLLSAAAVPTSLWKHPEHLKELKHA